MLNLIWAFMVIVGIIYALFTGNMEAVTNAALEGSKEAVSLAITMAGIVAFWMGIMEIAKEAKLIEMLTNKLSPFLHFMFPNIPKGHKSLEYIATNIIANILGLGWACTPAGLKAMEELSHINKNGDSASDEMCIFLILNVSSLQLIPVNMIAYRSQYGSSNPASIIAPSILATLVSTISAIIFCKIKTKNKQGFL